MDCLLLYFLKSEQSEKNKKKLKIIISVTNERRFLTSNYSGHFQHYEMHSGATSNNKQAKTLLIGGV